MSLHHIAFYIVTLFALAGAPSLFGSTQPDPTAKIKLVQKKYGCPFICLRFVRSGTHGIVYEGHEAFKLFITGNVYEDDFEQRVLKKADISCKGGTSAKLVDFQTQKYLMTDGLGNTKDFTKVTTIKTFSPAAHCQEAPASPSKKR